MLKIQIWFVSFYFIDPIILLYFIKDFLPHMHCLLNKFFVKGHVILPGHSQKKIKRAAFNSSLKSKKFYSKGRRGGGGSGGAGLTNYGKQSLVTYFYPRKTYSHFVWEMACSKYI